MPNGHGSKEYGKHEYVAGGTSDCAHGCGCWMGPARSGGPTGLDPFGKCPQNPKDGKFLGGKEDYDYVVNKRIRDLESRLYDAEKRLEAVKPNKVQLAMELESALDQRDKANQLLAKVRHLIGPA